MSRASAETQRATSEGRTSEERESLWILVGPPVTWAAHFLGSYLTAAVWCAKIAGPSGSLGGARIAILVYTALALVVLLALGARGWRRHASGGAAPPHSADTPESRYRFLGLATFLLSMLGFVAVLYAATAALVIGTCR